MQTALSTYSKLMRWGLLLFVLAGTLWAQKPEMVLQDGHRDTVRSVAFSPDGRFFLSAGDDKTVRLWEARSGRLVRVLEGHEGEVYQALFLPDGKSIVSFGRDQKLRFWDLAAGRETKAWAVPGSVSHSVLALSPDGKLLGAGSEDFHVWELATGRELYKISETPQALTFSSDGQTLAYSVLERQVKLINARTGQPLRAWPANAKLENQSLAFSPDGKLLAVVTFDGAVDLWDVAKGSVVRSVQGKNYRDDLETIAFSPDGKLLFVSDATHRSSIQRSLDLWEVASGRLVREIDARELVKGEIYGDSVAFHPDGKTFLTAGYAHILQWDTATGQLLRDTPNHSRETTSLVVNPVQKTVVMGTADKAAQLWDANIAVRCTFPDTGAFGSYILSPDGKMAILGNTSNYKRTFWRTDTCTKIGELDEIDEITFSPDGTSLILLKDDESALKLYNSRDLTLLRSLRGHTGNLTRAVFSPDGKWLASASEDKTAKIWQADGTLRYSLAGHTETVTDVAFSADSKLLATAAADHTAKVWDAATGQLRQSFSVPPNAAQRVAFAPDGKTLAVAGYAAPVRLFDVATGQPGRVMEGGPACDNAVITLEFSPDGKTILLTNKSSGHPLLTLWEARTGRILRRWAEDTAVLLARFSLDGKILAVSAGREFKDTSAGLYATETGDLLATVQGFTSGTWLVVTPEGLFDGAPEAWANVSWRFAGLTVLPVEIFFKEFYYPGLLEEILAGKRPVAPRNIGQLDRRQPEVALELVTPNAPASDQSVSARVVKLRVKVSEAPPAPGQPAGSGAQDVRLFHNGSLIKAWRGPVLQGQTTAAFEFSTPLIAGDNRFTAYAFNHDNIKSNDAILSVKGDDALRQAGTAYILAVGVNHYANDQFNLKYAVADVQAFSQEFSRQQTNLGRFATVKVIPLLDADATKANILNQFKQLAAQAQPTDLVVVYFAGHGLAYQNRFYLLPHDLGYTGSRAALDAAALQTIVSHGVSDRELETALEPVNAGQLMMIIDACNSGQALEAADKRQGPMNSSGLAQLAYEKGMYILTAAQSFQAALEAEKVGHGLLTYALVEEGLKTSQADRDQDNNIMVREWLDFTTRRVPELQMDMMQAKRGLGLSLAVVEGEEKIAAPEKRNVQRPRVFYRREPETQPLVVARP